MPNKSKTATINILLTGRPGVGKTTVIRRVADRLSGLRVAGFHTAEIREGGQRQGFRATTLAGGSCVLAHVSAQSRHRVGRYGVDVAAFERLVLPELARPCDVMLIDEIGRMECYSDQFIDQVRKLLDGSTPVIATVAVSGSGFISEVKARSDVEMQQVTHKSREELPRRLIERIVGLVKE